MQTPPSFNKKSEKNTFIAKLSTTVNTCHDYFLPSGQNLEDIPTPNDSFSFNKKSKDIFNPLENFSSVKKETPKFGNSENHMSTPVKEMIEKLTKIRNHIRWKKNIEEVIHLKKETKDHSHAKAVAPEKAGDFPNKINFRVKLKRSSCKNIKKFDPENDGFLENSSFLSKEKRLLSHKKTIKKSPKILGKNHLNFFFSNVNNRINQSPKNKTLFGINSRKGTFKIDRLKYEKRQKAVQKRQLNLNDTGLKKKLIPKAMWPNLMGALPDPNLDSKSPKIKAKHLTKDFQEELLSILKKPYGNTTNNSVFRSPNKKSQVTQAETTQDKASVHHKCEYSSSKNRGRRLNLRYQSARKSTYSVKKADNFGFRVKNLGKLNIDNPLFLREMRLMIDKKTRKSAPKNKPILPFGEFNTNMLFN